MQHSQGRCFVSRRPFLVEYLSVKKYMESQFRWFRFVPGLSLFQLGGRKKSRGCICILQFQNVLLKDLLFHLNISVPPCLCPKREQKTEHHILYEWKVLSGQKETVCLGVGEKTIKTAPKKKSSNSCVLNEECLMFITLSLELLRRAWKPR